MSQDFKDLFSSQAGDYARYRPHYPQGLFERLASTCAARELAWDVGTGNGQAAVALAAHFSQVIATDPSEKQLTEAVPHPRVEYRRATAEESTLPAASADLITVAQAFHWFQQERFFREVQRVGKPGASLAVWCYELALIDPAVDAVVWKLYRNVLGPYWEKERQLVEEGYRGVTFPFPELTSPPAQMRASWNLADLIGYLGTWSALQKFQKEQGVDPRVALLPELQAAWGNSSLPKAVIWPLSIRLFRLS